MEDVLELDLADGRGEDVREVVREDVREDGLVVKTDGAGSVVGVAFVRIGIGVTC